MGLLNNIIPGNSDKDSGKTKEDLPKNVNVEPKYEGLRPLVRSALMQEEISEKTVETLRKKAVSLGMDADEFEIFFNGLLAKKKKAGKKPLIGKGEISYDKYFEGNDFDNDFDQAFLTEEERTAKKGKASDEKSRKIDNVVGKAKSIGKLGAGVVGVLGAMGVVPGGENLLNSSILDGSTNSKKHKKNKNEDLDDFDDEDEDDDEKDGLPDRIEDKADGLFGKIIDKAEDFLG